VRRTFPDLPRGADRNVFVALCDHRAYRTIRNAFPDFRPPSSGAPVQIRPRRHFSSRERLRDTPLETVT
jgi:hypothetical protein